MTIELKRNEEEASLIDQISDERRPAHPINSEGMP
jgi:hypothetical protein